MVRNLMAALALAWFASAAAAQQAAPAKPTDEAVTLAVEARAALQALDFDRAAKLAQQLAEKAPNDAFRLRAADTLLRSGKAPQAVVLFDAYAEQHPDEKPYLWQRGIALFFVGRFADGAEQFEVHRRVNPNDVENAAWHYLCVAKKDSPEKADQLLLPAPGDPREPMEQVLEMFRTRDAGPVTERLKSIDQDTPTGKSAHFYGQLYLGLYADAIGKESDAKAHLDQAAGNAPRNYMGDVARVYAKHLAVPQQQTK